MKKINYLFTSILLLSILAISGCKKDNDPGISAEAILLGKFAQTWSLNSMTFDGGFEYNADFNSLTLTITSAKGYTTSNSPIYGPFSQGNSSGSWQFVGEITDPNSSAFQVERSSDGLIMNVQLTDTNMTLNFNFIDDDGDGVHDGRSEAVSGDWVFQFTR